VKLPTPLELSAVNASRLLNSVLVSKSMIGCHHSQRNGSTETWALVWRFINNVTPSFELTKYETSGGPARFMLTFQVNMTLTILAVWRGKEMPDHPEAELAQRRAELS
jgi:hypothetical protein